MTMTAERKIPADLKVATASLGESFAKALATFVREATRAGYGDREALRKRLESSEELNRLGRDYVDQLLEEDRKSAAKGSLETVKFSDIPRPRPTLQALVRMSGLTQKALARKLHMDAAVLSRVLKHPGRSKLSTVKRIAHALGAELGDVNLDDV